MGGAAVNMGTCSSCSAEDESAKKQIGEASTEAPASTEPASTTLPEDFCSELSAQKIFAQIDKNTDAKMTQEEFVAWACSNEEEATKMVSLLEAKDYESKDPSTLSFKDKADTFFLMAVTEFDENVDFRLDEGEFVKLLSEMRKRAQAKGLLK